MALSSDTLPLTWNGASSMMQFPSVGTVTYQVRPEDIKRFWSKVDRSGDCWIWKDALSIYGYGHISLGGRLSRAHRFSYWLSGRQVVPRVKGQELYEIHHECKNKACVRPSHLNQTSRAEHEDTVADRRRKLTHCSRGHLLSGANMRIETYGARRCIECHRIACQKYRDKVGNSSTSQKTLDFTTQH
jgi:hypothetical protein